MKTLLPILLLCCTELWSQTTPVSLFQSVGETTRSAVNLDKHISQYTLLQPDKAAWSSLLTERPASLRISLPFEGGITLELEQSNPLASDFILTASNAAGGTDTLDYDPGLHYSGKIAGLEHSLVAISIFEDQIMGVISDAEGNVNLGRVNTEAGKAAGVYVMYRDIHLVSPRVFSCGAMDNNAVTIPVSDQIGMMKESIQNACSIRIFYDCDQTIYFANGSNTVQTSNYLISLFNVVKTIYTNESVGIEISEIHVWTTLDPFRNDTRENALDDFTAYYRANGFNGHFAHLTSVTQITGLAWLNASYNNAFHFGFDGWLGAPPSYPAYSYSVQVLAHELGHNLGSSHTQWCGWPGGAIDNCFAVEGSCSPGPPPVNGGTIMSYCGPYPLSNGFGPLPGNVIRNFYNSYNDLICGGLDYAIVGHEGYRLRNASEIVETLQFKDCEPVWFYWSFKGARSEIKVELKYPDGSIQTQNYSASNTTLDLTWHRGHLLRNNLSAGAYNLKLYQKSGNNFVLKSEKNFTVVSTPAGTNCGEKLRLPFNYSIADASGSNNNPIAQAGSPVYDKDRFNSCNGAIRITGGAYLEAPVINERAVSFWFKMNQQAQMVIYDSGPNGVESKDFKIGVYKPEGLWGNASFDNSYGLFFTTWDRDIAIPFDALKSGWHHVAVSRDASGENKFRIMIDGQSPNGYVWDGVVYVQTWTAQSQPFALPAGGYGVPNLFVSNYKTYLGRDIQQSIEYFDGWLDDVRVFSQLLDQTEMLALYNVAKDDPTALSASATQTSYCEGQSIQLNASATAASSYAWAGPASFSSNQQNPVRANATSGMAGTYTVTVTVNGGCTATKTVSVSVASKPIPTLSVTNTCTGMNNGNITATTSGGSNFSYLWSNGQSTATISNLALGTYTVTVSNVATGCTASASATVNQAANLSINILNSVSPCANTSNGSISVGASGAPGPFTYQWSNGQTVASISNLAAGAYTVTVSASGSCATSTTVSLLSVASPTVNFSANINALGVTFSNFSANASSYNWNFGDGSNAPFTNPTHNYSNSGIYQVCLTATSTCGSATGCTGVSVSGTPVNHLDVQNGFTPEALVQTLFSGSCAAVTNVSFTGSSIQMAKFFGGMTGVGIDNGIILSTGNALEAEGPNDSQGTGTNTTGTVSDPDFSIINGGESVWDMASLEFDFVATVPNIQFDFVFASEEYCEYTQSQFRDACLFLVSGPGINGGFSSGAGNFAVLTGTNTPISVSTVNSEINSGYYINNLLADPSFPCIGIPAYGLGPVETQFDGLTKKIKTNLSLQLGQTYHAKIKISDSGDGIFDSAIFVQAGAYSTQAPTASVSSFPACSGQNNGSASASATGGVSPYFYNWSNGQTTATANNLTAGIYTVTATGSNGCTSSTTVTVATIPAPNVQVSNVVSSCSGLNNGSASVTVSGDATPYSYQWSNNQSSVTISNLAAGTYTVTVTGANGCSATTSATIQNLQVNVSTPAPVGVETATPGGTNVYNIPPLTDATSYTWTPPPGCSINGNPVGQSVTLPAAIGTSVSVTFGCGYGELCVTAHGNCISNTAACYTLNYLGDSYVGLPICPSFNGAADDCGNACVRLNFENTTFNNGAFTDFGQSFCGNGYLESSMWFSFIAPAANFEIIAGPENCENGDGLQMAVYRSCDDPNPLYCNTGQSGGGNTPLYIAATGMTPGRVYYLMMDTYSHDICDFTIKITPKLSFHLPELPDLPPIQGPAIVCPGEYVTFSIPAVPGAQQYIWDAVPAVEINGQNPPITLDASTGNTVQVRWDNTIGGQLSVTAVSGCSAKTRAMGISVKQLQATVLPTVIVCYEDAPYNTPWGDDVYTTGTYQTTFSASTGCDSIVKQTVVVKSPIITNLGQKIICEGESVSVCGELYGDNGMYSVVCDSYLGCDSNVTFSIRALSPVAQIIGNNTICANGSITLNSAPSPAPTQKRWMNGNGQTIGDFEWINITQPGVYILEALSELGGFTCIKRDTIVVLPSTNQPPSVSAVGGILGCASPTVIIGATSPDQNITYTWVGPDTFFSNQIFNTVSTAGVYTVIVTNQDGCTASSTATVSVENKTGTFLLSVNPAQISAVPAGVTDISIPATIHNQEPNPIDMAWERVFINLTPGCESKIEDKISVHPVNISTGAFSLAQGETAPLKLHLTDSDTAACCGVVRLFCRNTCTLKDTVTMVYIAGCLVGSKDAPEIEALQILPNPSSGIFRIDGPLPQTDVFIKVFSMDGRLVLNDKLSPKHVFSLMGHASGAYIVVFENQNRQPVKAVELILQAK
jgi:PKD repeat protein